MNKKLKKAAALLSKLNPSREKVRVTKGGLLALLLMTLVYAAVAFFNLGTTKTPETYGVLGADDAVVFDLGTETGVDALYIYYGIGNENSLTFEVSRDGETWQQVGEPLEFRFDQIFRWVKQDFGATGRYIRALRTSGADDIHVYEIVPAKEGAPLPVVSVSGKGDAKALIDEQALLDTTASHKTGMYFDEVYHARTAYEFIHHLKVYETTHPPLGKVLISAGIALFGMNPFGWRVVGTLFGVLMIPAMFLLALVLFKKQKYALLAAFLMAVDFMHFAQTRIATIDVYAVFFIILMYFFMFWYLGLDFYQAPLRKMLLPLGLSGLMFAFGAASKWTCLYAGAGLAVLYFWNLWRHYRFHEAAELLIARKRPLPENIPPELAKTLQKGFWPRAFKTSLWCLLFFVAVPGLIYVLSYLPEVFVPNSGSLWEIVVRSQKTMFNYHKDLVAEHSFSSPWYEWPMMVRPIWYFVSREVGSGMLSTISSFGNPAVWWGGVVTMLLMIALGIYKKDTAVWLILAGFLAQYLPWVLVPRLTFIYHFFNSVPFVILSIVYCARLLLERRTHKRLFRTALYSYLGLALLLFVAFYPVISGLVVPTSYVEALTWSPSWVFGV